MRPMKRRAAADAGIINRPSLPVRRQKRPPPEGCGSRANIWTFLTAKANGGGDGRGKRKRSSDGGNIEGRKPRRRALCPGGLADRDNTVIYPSRHPPRPIVAPPRFINRTVAREGPPRDSVGPFCPARRGIVAAHRCAPRNPNIPSPSQIAIGALAGLISRDPKSAHSELLVSSRERVKVERLHAVSLREGEECARIPGNTNSASLARRTERSRSLSARYPVDARRPCAG